ncbi:MAG: HPP family protein [Algoriphagus sp.]|uniref:HPP family protein n=1 Tax=Algoriphagus sp. TaxID=1872435 RepID=UPI00273048B4|nr:HPP family protein [Algoriphagus sp.]MDP2043502.1 HPP family protein [Algoriphagus sp.]MDP3472434.1 HPP family protein [Algoriphagus sp.]
MPTQKIKRGLRKARLIAYRETSHNPIDNLWAFVGSFLGLSSIGLLQNVFYTVGSVDALFLIGAFGASSVLLFGMTNSPAAQLRKLIFGSIISAFIGVSVYQLFSSTDYIWISPALAVSLSILAMQYTKTLHPPGGAIALIANIGSEEIRQMGYFYVINPVMTGILTLFLASVLINNLSKNRLYPYSDVNIRDLRYWDKIRFWKRR